MSETQPAPAANDVEARRLRRLEKRAKQREANVGRAAKMHAARLDCELPQLSRDDSAPALNVGCSGWFYWHWRGSFYPDGLATNAWFEHYSKHFSTVELNAPFYSWPTVNAVKTWVRQAPPVPFRYTVKACELITHVKRFSRTQTLVRDFGFIADVLGPRMGCFLFQLPPAYHHTPARLKSILAQMDPARRNVVEFRHRSWWQPKVFAAFQKAGVIFCSSSAPRLPDDVVATQGEVYVRFHGTTRWYRHDYTTAELQDWARRIRDSGARRVWAYFNNDRDAFSIKNATEFLSILQDMGLNA